jgi:hypothetical protein
VATKKNFYAHDIPELDDLIKRCNVILADLETKPRYRFKDLFERKKNYFELNGSQFKEIGFNYISDGETMKIYSDIQGVYIFYENNIPVYVGISRRISNRLRHHFIGNNHFQASLAFLKAREKWDSQNGLYKGLRRDFPFDDYRHEIQSQMMENFEIQIIPETCSFTRAMLEIMIASKYQVYWNSFETH